MRLKQLQDQQAKHEKEKKELIEKHEQELDQYKAQLEALQIEKA